MYYIGQTRSNKETRWKGHIKDSKRVDRTFNKNSHLYNAMRFYGSENFKVETLCECPDQEALDVAETFFIWFMGARKRSIGYNIASGGSHGKCSEETKEKISAANKGRVQTEEEKQRRSVSGKGKKRSPETRARIGASKKGVEFTPEHCLAISAGKKGKKSGPHTSEWNDNISKGNVGRVISLEQRQRISQSKKGKPGTPCSPETKELLREAFTGREITPEWRERISKTLTGRTLPPEHVENVAKANRGKKRTPEQKERLSIALKGLVRGLEARENIKSAAKKRGCPHLQKYNEERKGKPLSEEHKLALEEGKRKWRERLAEEKENNELG